MTRATRVRAARGTAAGKQPASKTKPQLVGVTHHLAAKLFAARGALADATSTLERKRIQHRVRVLQAAVSLLNALGADDVTLARAGRVSAKVLDVLEVADLYGAGDGRGQIAGKRMLLRVMERSLMGQVRGPLSAALLQVGETLRGERKVSSALPDTPTPSWPLSARIAFDFHTYGLCDDAVRAMFGSVPEKTILPMARALSEYAKTLDQHQTPSVEGLAPTHSGEPAC